MVNQLNMFGGPNLPVPEKTKVAQDNGLYDYQKEAVRAVEQELAENRGTLVLCATGTGKTQIACELIRRAKGRCLFIAHRDELIQQASNRIEQFTGVWPDIEQAELRAEHAGDRHVVASIQSLSKPKRLERFGRGEFSLIIVDEVHHGTSKTYRRVIDYFDSKLVGLTATPDRADKEALGQIIDSVAYRYDLPQAISDGWLCEIKTRRIFVDSVDFSNIHTLAGDFNQGELDKIMQIEENLHAVAKPTVDCAGDRKTIVFTTSVAHAERITEIIDRYAGKGKAFMVHGGTPKDKRKELLERFDRGEYQFFCNVGIATEGFDQPDVACVSMGRPTKSRSLYTQMVGRGTRGGRNRPVDGKVDCLILDFVGNSGRHELVTAVDILGGDCSDHEIEKTKELLQKANEPKSVDEAVKEAKEKLRLEATEAAKNRREGITAEVFYSVGDYNPYVMFDVKRDYLNEKYGMHPATEKQVNALRGIMKKSAKYLPDNLSKHEASHLLGELAKRRERGLSTYGQVACIAKKGIDARNWSFESASKVINWMANNRWRNPPPHVIGAIVGKSEPGVNG